MANLSVLAAVLPIDIDDRRRSLRKHLLLVAMPHPPLQRVLEKIEGVQLTKLIVVFIKYVLLCVLLEQPGPWEDPIRALLQSIPGAAAKERTSLNLAVELCLHRHTEGLLAVLEDAPDLHAHPVLAPLQARIDAAKSATPSLQDRLARVCARIVSPDLVVAEASLDEALALLTQIHASSADAMVRNLHVVVDALLNVAEYHPTPAVRATVCLGQLGAVYFGDLLGAAAAAMRGEATVSDKDGGLKTGVVAHQEIPVLCAEVLKSCLIPFFRSGASHFAQTIVAHAIHRLLKLHRKTCLDALDDFDQSTVRHLQDSKYRVDEPMLVAEADAAAAMFQPGATCWFCLRLAARCADSALVAVFRALHPLLAQTQHHEVATALGASHLFQQQQPVGGGGADTVQDPRHLALQHEVRVLAVYHAASVRGSSSGSVPTPPTRLSAYQAWRELGSFDLLAEQRTGAITAHRDAPRRRADVFREQRLSCACATIVDRHRFADLFTFHDTALLETRTAKPTNVEAIVNARY
ncbi:hypothetical protein H9P43_000357 [Blastocladiella emersonii ATCC 22665]|nr:hypothetical protein H9P43_000357 [Blastocladiella emersonii ATCC 22665]